MVRQLGALLGLAGALALAVSGALWVQEPNWRQLEANLPLEEQAQVLDALTVAGIEHTVGAGGRNIMVPAERLYEAKMTLATAGLAAPSVQGNALLDQDAGLGASRRMETTRFRRALEGELAQSIESLAGVQKARVHLALPERSVFLRSQAETTASVVLTRVRGGNLSPRQISGIQRLVAASVPELAADRVAILDPSGALLSKDVADPELELSNTQLTLKRELERQYAERVRNLLTPLLGAEDFRAEVALAMRFSTQEITREEFRNAPGEDGRGGMRSERWQRQLRPEGPGGVPGALTNAPPEAGLLVEEALQGTENQNLASEVQAEVLRNYELNKTISYERPSPWTIESLSVAVVYNKAALTEAIATRDGIEPAEADAQRLALEGELIALISNAIGPIAGQALPADAIRLTGASFLLEEAEEEVIEDEPFWSSAGFESIVRLVVTGLAVVLLILFVLRPFMKSVMTLPPPPKAVGYDPILQLSAPAAMPGLAPPSVDPEEVARAMSAQQSAKMNEWLDDARNLAQDDPRRLAQLTRQWMNTDG
jgi:flagellar M-ring protein FliF